jgi:hypothetical protein
VFWNVWARQPSPRRIAGFHADDADIARDLVIGEDRLQLPSDLIAAMHLAAPFMPA